MISLLSFTQAVLLRRALYSWLATQRFGLAGGNFLCWQ